MKLKLLFGIAVTAAISSNAIALQITNGKLIDHKEWTTAGAKSFIKTSKEPLKNIIDQMSNNKLMHVLIKSEIHSINTTIGQPTTFTNQGYISVVNKTDSRRDYNYGIGTCASSDVSGNLECVYYENRVQLEPQGEFFDEVMPSLVMTYNTPGVYDISARTFYDGWGQNRDTPIESSNNESYAKVIVS